MVSIEHLLESFKTGGQQVLQEQMTDLNPTYEKHIFPATEICIYNNNNVMLCNVTMLLGAKYNLKKETSNKSNKLNSETRGDQAATSDKIR